MLPGSEGGGGGPKTRDVDRLQNQEKGGETDSPLEPPEGKLSC